MNQSVKSNPIRLSVVITAYNRFDYVLQAIASVLRQDLPRQDYEILLIKNYIRPELEDYCQREGIRVTTCEGTMGEYIALGISQARGKVICFLEDDDLFDPAKLTGVAALHSELDFAYLHNGYTTIDGTGSSLGPLGSRVLHLKGTGRHRLVVRTGSLRPSQVSGLLRAEADFNMSCISISRDFGSLVQDRVAQIKGCFDGFLLFQALEMGGAVVAVPRLLTSYRVHDSMSLSGSNDPERKARLLSDGENQIAALKLAETLTTDPVLIPFIRYLRLERRIRNDSLSAGSRRADVAAHSIETLVQAVRYRDLYGVAWALVAVSSLLSRKLPGKLVNSYFRLATVVKG
jgi:glycosyltransferase involved in cell wall biosynthesis